jgi:aminoglycoside phosphotransferase (APT) family kinase protein
MGFELIDALAELGKVDAQAVGLGDLGKPEGFLTRQVPRWLKQLRSYEDTPEWSNRLPGVADIGAWLSENCPSHFVPGILHGDYHFANVLYSYDGPSLIGIVDWELTTLGDPLLDLGWVLCGWPESDGSGPASAIVTPWQGFPTPGEIISRYEQNSVRDVSRIRWYAILACYKLAIIVEGTYARALAGKAEMASGLTLHKQAVALLERALNWIDDPPACFMR